MGASGRGGACGVRACGHVVAYGIGLEYRFEVAIITIDHFALVLGGAIVAASARRTSLLSGEHSRVG